MARTIGSDGEKTQNAIREAAVRLIARRGFEAVSMRLLAAEVGVQAAALYRYFPNKEELLFSLMREHMRGLTAAWETARPAGGGPAARLAAFTANHIRFHVGRRHSIENCFAKIKEFRGIATRYDKTDTGYAANRNLTAMLIEAR